MPNILRILLPSLALAVAITGIHAGALPTPSGAQASPYAMLAGSWRGTGTVAPPGGAPERVACRLRYDLSGDTLNQNLDCAGADYRISATGNFRIRGDDVTGTWREPRLNIGGSASGSARGNTIYVRISGDRFEGRMSIQVPNQSSHSVEITQFDAGSGRYTRMASINFSR